MTATRPVAVTPSDPDRHTSRRCDACLGPLEGRGDQRLCSVRCRKAASRAMALTSYEDADTEQRRIRSLAGRDQVETLGQWEAVDAHPQGRARLRVTREAWTALGERLRAQRAEVEAFLARHPDDDYRPGPMVVVRH